MAFEFRLEIDTPTAQREGKHVLVGFTPLQDSSPQEFETAATFLRAAANRIEAMMKKHGVGEVLPEQDDAPAEEFTDEDRKALQEEVEQEG